MDLPALSCPGCPNPLTADNSKDFITYICEHGCSMHGNPRNYIQLNYRFNKWQLSKENLDLLLKISFDSHRLITVQ